jgi:K+-transporting ATPase ATPase C chain
MARELMIAIRSTIVFWVLTAILYPLFVLVIGFAFPYQANGSLVTNEQGQAIGSALIGQTFTANQYFWSRPSTCSYSEGEGEEAPKTVVGGASNLAPSNPDLIKRIQEETMRLQQAGITPTPDLVYTSGSCLDPHISIEAAKTQIDRIASARSMPVNQVETLIAQNTEGRFLGIFGDRGVNVLKLNLALDDLKSAS